VASSEQLAVDGLELNDGTNYVLEALTMPPAQKKPVWVTGGDTDGAILDRTSLYDNAQVVARVRVVVQSTMDLAVAKLAALGDKLQESERNNTGVAITWTPADGTIQATGRVLSGEITDLPITVDGDGAGWFVKAPVVTVTLTRDPFWRGAEVTAGTTSASTLPVVTLELTGVAGDVPGEGRLVVTDAASQSRRLVRWGLESRFYPTSSPPGLLLDSDSLVTSGFAGTGTTRSGAYDPGAAGNSVIRGTLALQTIAVCGTGVQTHVGAFHVFARVWATETTSGAVSYVRLSWQDGDGPLRSNAYTTTPLNAAWVEVDLGIITTTTALSGTQKWLGRIDAYSTVVGETLDVDYIYLVPAQEGYGEARGIYSYTPGVQVARDEFTGRAAALALNTLVAPSGGTWATSGVATDFVAADAPASTDETMSRSTATVEASPRFAILGATNYTDVEAGVDNNRTGSGYANCTVIARWVDSSNYLTAILGVFGFTIVAWVAGVAVSTAVESYTTPSSAWHSLRLIAFTSGTAIATVLDAGGAVIRTVQIQHSSIATGGALATGKPGFSDQSTLGVSPSVRYFDNFYVATPAPEAVVVYSGRTGTFASTYAQRQDSTGTYAGDVPGYRGTRFYVPPAGTRTRKTRIAVVARRNDIVVAQDDQIADSTTISALVTPRYVNVPR
jgi:hypothetical protein